MKAVVQRVARARVTVSGRVTGEIERGLLVLLGAARGDTHEDMESLADKIVHLRIFEDDHGKMNLSLLDTGGAALVVSQFTLLADCRKGRRPSFFEAMPPEGAEPMCRAFAEYLRRQGVTVEEGVFGAMMDVELVNAGPVTIVLDSAIRR